MKDSINKTFWSIVLLLLVIHQQNNGGGVLQQVPQNEDDRMASSISYDCSVGCHFDGRIVCGEDDITYPSECFAMCQVMLFLFLFCFCS
jgi:hypothetical protein